MKPNNYYKIYTCETLMSKSSQKEMNRSEAEFTKTKLKNIFMSNKF